MGLWLDVLHRYGTLSRRKPCRLDRKDEANWAKNKLGRGKADRRSDHFRSELLPSEEQGPSRPQTGQYLCLADFITVSEDL